MENETETISTKPKERSTVLIALGMIFGILWLGLFLFAAVRGYGESGLESFIFLSTLSFPSSFLLNLVPIFNPNAVGKITFLYLVAVFIVGFLQWFVLVPYLFEKITDFFKRNESVVGSDREP